MSVSATGAGQNSKLEPTMPGRRIADPEAVPGAAGSAQVGSVEFSQFIDGKGHALLEIV